MLQNCQHILSNVHRLRAVAESGLLDSLPEEVFTRLNHLASKALRTPISVFSIFGEDRQYFKTAAGADILPYVGQSFPLDVSVCQYTLQGKPLAIKDTKSHPLFRENPAVQTMNIVGYLGIPVTTLDGHAIGAVCVIDHVERVWTEEEIALLEDITGAFMKEIELRRSLKAAQLAIAAREEFLSIATHELKTPITSLKLQSQLVQRRMTKGTLTEEEHTTFHLDLQRQIARLNLLIDDMSDISRIDSGQLHLNLSLVDLEHVIEDLISQFAAEIGDAGSTITFLSEPLGPIQCDPTRIGQVVGNLIKNAIKYAPGSQVEVNLARAGEALRISCRDTGPGISREDQDKIFSKYERGVKQSDAKGLGLGLFISRKIAEAHRGTLVLESEPGKGSTFHLTLPRR